MLPRLKRKTRPSIRSSAGVTDSARSGVAESPMPARCKGTKPFLDERPGPRDSTGKSIRSSAGVTDSAWSGIAESRVTARRIGTKPVSMRDLARTTQPENPSVRPFVRRGDRLRAERRSRITRARAAHRGEAVFDERPGPRDLTGESVRSSATVSDSARSDDGEEAH